ncbi:crosslink repair DNA glycosylase YcaQ family protein [uncultured Tateyamaria sp.]|uniref:winged helix-turn-helix domain-containing protein n=1 Tax=uncultured Tateyamaria sp. TaxID=455651 RepID=UPI00261C8C90|nr:crosslink repair DNA glycosylase YcaQ family protein [uncultured Tateyamaria sp.]
MTPFTLSNTQARRVFLHRHLLTETPAGPAHGAALLDLITQLGFVQLDSINTVARAHDLILFARKPRYRPKNLKNLYERDRALFEHWTHDAAVIPSAFYPYWHLRRERDAARLRDRWSEWRRDGFEAKFQPVLDRIREQGPCCSGDVGQDEKRGSGGWWDWHPSKTALEYLWRSGALQVVKREGFQKYYDLTERVLDARTIGNAPDVEETIDWCCREALSRLGFATHGELAAFWDHVSPAEAKAWCAQAFATGRIMQVNVTGVDGVARTAFAWPNLPDDPALHHEPTSRLRVLSPFDPALRDRKRAERLFGFAYRIEIFVPEPKRTYGYYVFPLMEGDQIVGRVDMKAHRADDVLRVRAVWPERKVRWGKGRQAAFETELDRVTKVAGVSQIAFEDGWLRTAL